MELQRAFDVSPTTVQNWKNDPDFPGGSDGPWTHSQVELYQARRRSSNQPADAGGPPSKSQQLDDALKGAALKIRLQQARRLEFENDLREKKLRDVDELAEELEQAFSFVRDQLVALPDQLASRVPAEAKAGTITGARLFVMRMLNELANREKRIQGSG